MANERNEKTEGTESEKTDGGRKEITLKFGKGCVGEEFKGRDGKAYKEILVPNVDKNDTRPWQTFVVRSNQVHDNQFGKGMWLKLPADGNTTLHRSTVIGEKPDGKKEWGTEKTVISNKELKGMMEAYKERPRESFKDKMAQKKAEATTKNEASKSAPKQTKTKIAENAL